MHNSQALRVATGSRGSSISQLSALTAALLCYLSLSVSSLGRNSTIFKGRGASLLNSIAEYARISSPVLFAMVERKGGESEWSKSPILSAFSGIHFCERIVLRLLSDAIYPLLVGGAYPSLLFPTYSSIRHASKPAYESLSFLWQQIDPEKTQQPTSAADLCDISKVWRNRLQYSFFNEHRI